MIANIANLAVWLLVATTVVVFGWDEPLRYRFMSSEAVRASERVLQPQVKAPDYREWRPSTALKTGGGLGHAPIGGRGSKGGGSSQKCDR